MKCSEGYKNAKTVSEPEVVTILKSMAQNKNKFDGYAIEDAWAGTEAEDYNHIDIKVKTSVGKILTIDVKDVLEQNRGTGNYMVQKGLCENIENNLMKDGYFACRRYKKNKNGRYVYNGEYSILKMAEENIHDLYSSDGDCIGKCVTPSKSNIVQMISLDMPAVQEVEFDIFKL